MRLLRQPFHRTPGAGASPRSLADRVRRIVSWLLLLFLALSATAALGSSGVAGPGAGQPLYAAASMSAPPAPLEVPAVAPDPAASIVRTALFREIWGTVTVDGAPAPVGAIVMARSPRGDVVGSFTVTQPGRYGYMRIYGEHQASARLLPGMRANEEVALVVDGRPASAAPGPAPWADDRRPSRVDLVVEKR